MFCDLVEVVEHGHAGLVLAALPLLPVVGLRLADAARAAPGAVATSARRRDPSSGRRPVPAWGGQRYFAIIFTIFGVYVHKILHLQAVLRIFFNQITCWLFGIFHKRRALTIVSCLAII